MEKLLSICIPTYNRKELLQKHLKNVFEQLKSFDSEDVELIVSVNPANDGTEEYVRRLSKTEKFIANFNDVNIGGTPNIMKTFDLAHGRYVWVMGDDDELIEGIIEKVVVALRQYTDLSWIFINAARTKNDKVTGKEIITEPKCYWGDGGYFKDGLATLKRMFKIVDNRILFSTSNVYLREAAIEVMNSFSRENNCRQLAYIFNSAHSGAAYIINDTYIIAGCNITWGDKYYETEVRYFNEALLKIADLECYTEKDAKNLIRYRMTHEAIDIWFLIFKKILNKPSVGIADYIYYLKLFPGLTIIMTIVAPFSACYLLIRHHIRTKKRQEALNLVLNSKSTPREIRERC